MIPTVAALVLGGLRMKSALDTSASYTRLQTLAGALPQIDSLADVLQTERDLTVGQLAAVPRQSLTSVASQRAATDSALAAFRARLVTVDVSHNVVLRTRLTSILTQLNGLTSLRQGADSGDQSPVAVSGGYTSITQNLVAITSELVAQSPNVEISTQATGLQSLANANVAASQQRAILYAALLGGVAPADNWADLASASTAQQIGVVGFQLNADAIGQTAFSSTVTGPSVQTVAGAVSSVLATHSLQGIALSAAQWWTASTEQIAAISQVQASALARLTEQIHVLSQGARDDALLSGGVIYLILALALLATLLVARSILRPLRQLRSAALDVAYQRLPDTVRRLQDSEGGSGPDDVVPITVRSSDEIGQVARAFDAVHVEAVRLAGAQAMMRENVSKMFVNLSRRSQTLVERQLRLIDELEAGEQDADQLANLFRLDHLATRMRRNDENLLVLAGEDGGRRRSDPVALLDVLRAASAEVEQYSRVRLDAQEGFELDAGAVNDVVHLLAELVENATTFSAPSTAVWLRSHRFGTSNETVIEVEDEGIGMTDAELAAANEKLSAPTGMDVSMSRLMGLFVVARLAQRQNIRVQLRRMSSGGVIADVWLPAGLVSSSVPAAPVPTVAATHPESPRLAVPVTGPARAEESIALHGDSPIFNSLQSEWFTGRMDEPSGTNGTNGTAKPATREPVNWQSPGDEGFRVAAALTTPEVAPDARTGAGLPVRVPGRNLIPGSTTPDKVSASPKRPVSGSGAQGGQGDLERRRGLSSYQQGVRRARVNGHATTDGPGSGDDE